MIRKQAGILPEFCNSIYFFSIGTVAGMDAMEVATPKAMARLTGAGKCCPEFPEFFRNFHFSKILSSSQSGTVAATGQVMAEALDRTAEGE